jgi:hypothetical protein
MSDARKPDESFEDYKKRQKIENLSERIWLKGVGRQVGKEKFTSINGVVDFINNLITQGVKDGKSEVGERCEIQGVGSEDESRNCISSWREEVRKEEDVTDGNGRA